MHTVIVGAGIFGASAALALRDAGADVTLLEARSPGHPWAASGDWSRVMRVEYGQDLFLTELALRARTGWFELERRLGVRLYDETGLLILAPADGGWERISLDALRAAGHPSEALDEGEVRRRFPVIGTGGVTFATFNPIGGIIASRRATEALTAAAESAGVRVCKGARATGIELSADRATGVRLESGERILADAIVLAPGAWGGDLLPQVGAPAPVATRQTVVYFDAPIERYGADVLPAFGEVAQGVSGVPAWEGRGLKLTLLEAGTPIQPGDAAQRELRLEDLAPYRSYIERRFPGIVGAKVTEGHVCCFAMTRDEEFLVGRAPSASNVILATGFSGHGFKFAPALAPEIAALVLERAPSIDLERFDPGRPAARPT